MRYHRKSKTEKRKAETFIKGLYKTTKDKSVMMTEEIRDQLDDDLVDILIDSYGEDGFSYGSMAGEDVYIAQVILAQRKFDQDRVKELVRAALDVMATVSQPYAITETEDSTLRLELSFNPIESPEDDEGEID